MRTLLLVGGSLTVGVALGVFIASLAVAASREPRYVPKRPDTVDGAGE